MFARRRPLLRAAAVGGGSYVAGKKAAERSAQEAGREAEQNERIARLEEGRPEQGVPQAGRSIAEQLKELSALHGQGVLSDEEFAAAKSKLLGT